VPGSPVQLTAVGLAGLSARLMEHHRARPPAEVWRVAPRDRAAATVRLAPSGGAQALRRPRPSARPAEERQSGRRLCPGAPLRRPHPRRRLLPPAGHEKRALPHARRQEHWRPHARGPAPLPHRPPRPRLPHPRTHRPALARRPRRPPAAPPHRPRPKPAPDPPPPRSGGGPGWGPPGLLRLAWAGSPKIRTTGAGRENIDHR
jgi:hypothetical protein